VKVIEEGTINHLDGVVLAAIPAASSKRRALKRMEADSLAKLPVVDEAGRLIGSVEPDKLS
jgi:CBS domain-containing protein